MTRRFRGAVNSIDVHESTEPHLHSPCIAGANRPAKCCGVHDGVQVASATKCVGRGSAGSLICLVSDRSATSAMNVNDCYSDEDDAT